MRDNIVVILSCFLHLNSFTTHISTKVASLKFYMDAGLQPMEDSGKILQLSPPSVGDGRGDFFGHRYPF